MRTIKEYITAAEHFVSLQVLRHLQFLVIAVLAVISLWGSYFYLWLRTTIIADGKQTVVHSRPITVAAILKRQKITVGQKDIVEPSLNDPMPRRGVIRVIRVTETIEKQDESLPFTIRWTKRSERNIRPVEMQKGVLRRRIKDVRIVRHDGKEVTRLTVRQRDIKKTIFRLVLYGADGVIERVYDLSQCPRLKMLATAYYPGDPLAWRDGTITCLDEKMERGVVAVDPRVIPLRTRVYVPGYGYGYAGDTGSAIKKMRIDLGVNNAEEEKEWMHRPVVVYILEKNTTR